MDVVTLGETLVCLTSESSRLAAAHSLRKSIGGAESNTAVGLARLGHSVAWISRVGSDPFGDEILRTLRGEGVDVRHVSRSPSAPTGLMVKERRGPDDIHVYYYRTGSAASEMTEADVPDALAAGARRAHLTGITLALGAGPARAVHRLLALCSAHGVRVSFDPNLRLKLWSLETAKAMCEDVFRFVDELLVNEGEALALAGTDDLDKAIDYLAGFEFDAMVIKRGASGVLGVHDGRLVPQPARPGTVVVDTVGAGDAFNAGFLHARLRDQPFERALHWGTTLASFVVAHPGDYEGLPDAEEFAAVLGATEGPAR